MTPLAAFSPPLFFPPNFGTSNYPAHVAPTPRPASATCLIQIHRESTDSGQLRRIGCECVPDRSDRISHFSPQARNVRVKVKRPLADAADSITTVTTNLPLLHHSQFNPNYDVYITKL